ncbi:hypothetical protein CN510_17380 [Priestia megaterium]|nr:hypothetical protein CN510_17380 [Priestia megaterium]
MDFWWKADEKEQASLNEEEKPSINFEGFELCIAYSEVVNIITLSGTHHKKEPLVAKSSR